MSGLEDIPRVSIVMPVYNCEKYVQSAIDSILNQTFTNFEFIIVNDGSTDNTSRILEDNSYDPRVKILSQQNLGVTKALNNGINICRAFYIARQDADDLSHPDRLKIQVDFLDKFPNIALVGTWAKSINELGEIISPLNFPCNADEIRKSLMIQNCFIHGSVMVRYRLLKEIGTYNESIKLAQDYDLWLRLSEKFELNNIPHYLYYYRKHAASVSNHMKQLQDMYIEIARNNALRRREIFMNSSIKFNVY